MTKISWVLGRVGDLGRGLQRDWTDWIDSFLGNRYARKSSPRQRTGLVTLGHHYWVRIFAAFVPYMGILPLLPVLTTIDLYIHTISHPIWVSRGGFKKTWIGSTKFIKNGDLKSRGAGVTNKMV